MKFIIINSFRMMVYVAFIAIILGGLALGIFQKGEFSAEALGLTGTMSQVADFVIFTVGGWIAASIICGLIVTLMDIRDDINDRLPDARRDI